MLRLILLRLILVNFASVWADSHHHGGSYSDLRGGDNIKDMVDWGYLYLVSLERPTTVTLDKCSTENSLPGGHNYDDGRGLHRHCVIGLGEQLSGQVVAKARKDIVEKPQIPPICQIYIWEDSVCGRGDGNGKSTQTDILPCPGEFNFDDTEFPVQKGDTVRFNFTVTGEQRFLEFLKDARDQGYHCPWWFWSMLYDVSGDWLLDMGISFQFSVEK